MQWHMAKWLMAYGLSRGTMRFYLWDVLRAVAITHPHLFEHWAPVAHQPTSSIYGAVTSPTGPDTRSICQCE